MSKSINKRIAYLHDCYQSDNRQTKLSNFLDPNRVEKPLFMDQQEELLFDVAPKLAIDGEKAEELAKLNRLYAREKELLYASIFVLGTEYVFGKSRKVCAPLLLFPASITKKDEYYFLSVDTQSARLNTGIFELLTNGVASADELKFISELPEAPFDYGSIARIERLLMSHYGDLDCKSLLMYPELWSEKRIRRQLQPKQRSEISFFKVIPASAVGLVSKSANTYGILSELNELGKKTDFSDPINIAFGESQSTAQKADLSSPGLPTVLNTSQKRALLNARSEACSLIVGPPGTGKSYTIACMALDHMMRGESVLISSRQDEAVDVIAHKIAELLESDKVFIRGGAKGNLRKMRKQLRGILTRFSSRSGKMQSGLRSNFNTINKEVEELEKDLKERLEQEIRWSEELLGNSAIEKLKSFVIKTIHRWFRPHWKILFDLNKKLERRSIRSRQMIQANYNDRMYKLLNRNRKSLQQLYDGLRTSNSSERDSIFKQLNFEVLIQAFPIWLCKLSDLYRIMPMEKHLFDLVIIDESSQCDIASSLPAIQRAKRVVVCGDPNQLRHVSFLSKAKMLQIAGENGLADEEVKQLNFRDTSFLDWISSELRSQKQVSFLDEHYRSLPEIIRFSNKEFYSASLRIMSDRPIPPKDLPNVEVKVNGSRNEKGVNELEAEVICQRVLEIVGEEKDKPDHLKSSIGILSLFRDQADFISRSIRQFLSYEEIGSHRISVGTAYAYQGEERDIMFLSFAVDNNSHHAAFTHANKPDVFNVSITRAKSKQYVVHSLDTKLLVGDHYLKMFIEDIRKPASSSLNKEELSHDEFMDEVEGFLREKGLEFWTYYHIAGIPIDLLIRSGEQYLGIDLVGYPGIYQDALSVERFKILSRAGVVVFPLAYSFWKFRREECEEELLEFVKFPAEGSADQ